MTYVFADCELDARLYTLRRAERVFHLRPKVFQVLLYLLDHSNRVVSKQELLEHAWPGQFISEATLEGCIKQVRQALGDSGRAQRVLQTLHGHGYRIVVPVEILPETAPSPEVASDILTPPEAASNTSLSVLPDSTMAAPESLIPPALPGRVERKRCAGCQHANSADATFCVACGARLVQSCVHCGQHVPLPAAFCFACGYRLSTRSGPALSSIAVGETLHAEGHQMTPASETPPGERKLVTILCGALGQAPGLARRPGLDALHDEMRALYALARREIQRYGGTLQHVTGDRFMAVFGVPVAQEDHAQRAVLAALGLQQRLDESQSNGGAAEEALTLRLSLHTGPVAVGGMDDAPELAMALVGDTALLAAALEELGEPGVILCSDITAQLVQGLVHVKTLGSVQVAGQSTEVLVHRVLGRQPRRPPVMPQGERGFSQFVGRTRELTTLRGLLGEVEDGRGQVVGMVGEPGMGKSRLVYEFRCSVQERRLTYLAGRCFSYGSNTPYLPVLDLLRYHCGLTDADTPKRITTNIRQSLQVVGMAVDEWAPLLLRLLGVQMDTDQLATLSPEALKARTFAALIQMCINYSQQQPLVLEIENLHWIDATSEEFLTALVERVAGLPILVLVTYRPGYRPAWIDKSYVTQIALQRLAPHDSRQVIQSVLQTTVIPESLVQHLLLKAEGNPFFLEELAWTVREHGDSHAFSAVPNTIQAVLAARIDRLPPTAKRLLQVAAVLGKEVRWPLLQGMAGVPEQELRDGLRHLQATEFLYETHLFPDVLYTFKHVLTQEVAYQSLLKGTRQHYHRQAAQVLMERFPEHAETHPELLAHHYTEGGVSAQALRYWQRAGQQAAQRSAYVEAISHFTTGLQVLKELPDSPERRRQELDLQMALAPALMTIKGYGAPEVEQAYTRAYTLSQQLGETSQLFWVLLGLQSVYLNRAEHNTARSLSEQLLNLAQHQQAPLFSLLAHYTMGNSLFYLGQFVASRQHFVQAMHFYDPQQHRSIAFVYGEEPGVRCQSRGILPLLLLGYPDQALQEIQQALALSSKQEHPYSVALCLYYAVRLHQFRREIQATYEQAEKLIVFCTEQGFAHYLAQGMILRGWAVAAQGQPGEGIAQMFEGLSAYQATRGQTGRPHLLALLAAAHQTMSQTEQALRLIAEALALIDHTAESWWAAEIHRLKGELLLQEDTRHTMLDAERCFLQALDIARRQQAKALELRVTMSLSRLWQQSGKHAEARQQLGEIYGWFTEGFATADLQEARELLEDLA